MRLTGMQLADFVCNSQGVGKTFFDLLSTCKEC